MVVQMGLIYRHLRFNRLYDPLTFMCFRRAMHGGVSGGGGGGRDHIKDPLEVRECNFKDFSPHVSQFFSHMGFLRRTWGPNLGGTKCQYIHPYLLNVQVQRKTLISISLKNTM